MFTSRRFRRSLFAAMIALIVTPEGSRADEPPPFEPTNRYESRTLEGWTLLVNKTLLEDRELADRTLTLLRFQLYQVTRRVPEEPLKRLRSVRIWVEKEEPHHPCMAYHPAVEWLKEHGMNPEKARCVELANARTFLDWTKQQPWMVFHELSHAYHHQFLEGGFENAGIREAFDRAKDSHRYDSVLAVDGQERKAYALTNRMEYFAESSEAFFGTNDFYPFVRPELRRHDQAMEELLKGLWKTP
ncbi:hypothetical protein ACYOEI_28605 [Singulisphaera rosea]